MPCFNKIILDVILLVSQRLLFNESSDNQMNLCIGRCFQRNTVGFYTYIYTAVVEHWFAVVHSSQEGIDIYKCITTLKSNGMTLTFIQPITILHFLF